MKSIYLMIFACGIAVSSAIYLLNVSAPTLSYLIVSSKDTYTWTSNSCYLIPVYAYIIPIIMIITGFIGVKYSK
jgi:hypothetical protein